MIATLSRVENTTQYQVSNLRSFDAWGVVRSGSGGPTQRYCASLGHVQDDESSLIYMRARYYEPSTGRFISEDRERRGSNWVRYCSNRPLTNVDPDGNSELAVTSEAPFYALMALGGALIIASTFAFQANAWTVSLWCMVAAIETVGSALGCFTNLSGSVSLLVFTSPLLIGACLGIAKSVGTAMKLPNGAILGITMSVHTTAILALLIDISSEGVDLNAGE